MIGVKISHSIGIGKSPDRYISAHSLYTPSAFVCDCVGIVISLDGMAIQVW